MQGGHEVPTLWFSVFGFPSPVRRLDISPTSGDLGEHCSSSAVGHVLCAPPGRVAQPRLLAKYRGNPEGAVNRGRLLWVTFLGKTRKVTSCRATPNGVGLEERSCFDKFSTNGLVISIKTGLHRNCSFMHHQRIACNFNESTGCKSSFNARQIRAQQFFQFCVADIAGGDQ